MDSTHSSLDQADRWQHPRIEGALAGASAGGLIGLMLGPIGTLACAVIGAAAGYLTYRPSASS